MDWLASAWTYFVGPLVIALLAIYVTRIIDRQKSFLIGWRKRKAIEQYHAVAQFKNGTLDIHAYLIIKSMIIVVFMVSATGIAILGSVLILRYEAAGRTLDFFDTLAFGAVMFISGLAYLVGILRFFQLATLTERYQYFWQYKAQLERRFAMNLDSLG